MVAATRDDPPRLVLVVGAQATSLEIARQKNSQHVREVVADEEPEVLFIGHTDAITCEGDGHEHEWLKVAVQAASWPWSEEFGRDTSTEKEFQRPDGDQGRKLGPLGHRRHYGRLCS